MAARRRHRWVAPPRASGGHAGYFLQLNHRPHDPLFHDPLFNAGETLTSGYVRTARAEGLHEWLVLLCHALPNALIPLVTVLRLEFGFILGGAILVETVFSYLGSAG